MAHKKQKSPRKVGLASKFEVSNRTSTAHELRDTVAGYRWVFKVLNGDILAYVLDPESFENEPYWSEFRVVGGVLENFFGVDEKYSALLKYYLQTKAFTDWLTQATDNCKPPEKEFVVH